MCVYPATNGHRHVHSQNQFPHSVVLQQTQNCKTQEKCVPIVGITSTVHSGKWNFEDYCSNKGLILIKNRFAYFCPQLPVQLN